MINAFNEIESMVEFNYLPAFALKLVSYCIYCLCYRFTLKLLVHIDTNKYLYWIFAIKKC